MEPAPGLAFDGLTAAELAPLRTLAVQPVAMGDAAGEGGVATAAPGSTLGGCWSWAPIQGGAMYEYFYSRDKGVGLRATVNIPVGTLVLQTPLAAGKLFGPKGSIRPRELQSYAFTITHRSKSGPTSQFVVGPIMAPLFALNEPGGGESVNCVVFEDSDHCTSLGLYAGAEIARGAELLISYGAAYEATYPRDAARLCQADGHCRKRIHMQNPSIGTCSDQRKSTPCDYCNWQRMREAILQREQEAEQNCTSCKNPLNKRKHHPPCPHSGDYKKYRAKMQEVVAFMEKKLHGNLGALEKVDDYVRNPMLAT